jgi:hypothetical protein
MLVFYTWAVRLLADTVSLFAATEDIGWLAEETPQEGAALIAGGGDGKDGGNDALKREDSAKKLSALPQKSFNKKRKTATLKGQWPTNGMLPCAEVPGSRLEVVLFHVSRALVARHCSSYRLCLPHQWVPAIGKRDVVTHILGTHMLLWSRCNSLVYRGATFTG